jgi:hypothetical protein
VRRLARRKCRQSNATLFSSYSKNNESSTHTPAKTNKRIKQIRPKTFLFTNLTIPNLGKHLNIFFSDEQVIENDNFYTKTDI